MKEASKKFPKSSLIKSFLIRSYSSVDNETDMSKELEALKELAPESYQALALVFDEEMEKEEYEKAEEAMEKMIDLYGEDIVTVSCQIQLASARERDQELIGIIKRAYKKYPDNSKLAIYRHLVYKSEKNNRKATKTLKKYLKSNYPKEVAH